MTGQIKNPHGRKSKVFGNRGPMPDDSGWLIFPWNAIIIVPEDMLSFAGILDEEEADEMFKTIYENSRNTLYPDKGFEGGVLGFRKSLDPFSF